MLSIHNNLSAGVQNVTGAYVVIMLVYRRLLTMRLHGKVKYMRRHCAIVTNYITCKPSVT